MSKYKRQNSEEKIEDETGSLVQAKLSGETLFFTRILMFRHSSASHIYY